jgi:hypothetical protein
VRIPPASHSFVSTSKIIFQNIIDNGIVIILPGLEVEEDLSGVCLWGLMGQSSLDLMFLLRNVQDVSTV